MRNPTRKKTAPKGISLEEICDKALALAKLPFLSEAHEIEIAQVIFTIFGAVTTAHVPIDPPAVAGASAEQLVRGGAAGGAIRAVGGIAAERRAVSGVRLQALRRQA